MRATILCLALIPALAVAQTAPQPAPSAPRPKKVLTPDQIVYQAQMKTYYAEHARLAAGAVTAYNAELAREKSPECPNASTTYDINMCLSKEGDITDANYKAFTSALRAMLDLPAPKFPGEQPYVGPSGPAATPATSLAAYDAAESAWQTYATAECAAVESLWRGGTIVNSMVGHCELRLARARLHELNDAYEMPLHH